MVRACGPERAAILNARCVLSDELISILICPETKQRLRLATPEELALANVEQGLIREDGQVVYPVQDEIAMLMLEYGVRIAPPKN